MSKVVASDRSTRVEPADKSRVDKEIETPQSLYMLAEQLGDVLLKKSWRLVLAESCTGGGVASAVTEVPGASAWFDGGYVVYANRAKQRDLGVPEAMIAQSGAVSESVAKAMVLGLLARNKEAQTQQSAPLIGAAITGVAGPEGGSLEKPVGTVWFGFAVQSGELVAECQHFSGDRRQVRTAAIAYCLKRLISIASQRN